MNVEMLELLTVIFTGCVAISTVVYAILTWRLVSETRKMRAVQTEPKIHITLTSYDFSVNLIRLKIQNIGLGLAYNLKFEPSVIAGGKPAESLLEEFTESDFFKTGLRYLAPGQRIYSNYTNGASENFEEKLNAVLSFKLDYENAIGRKFSNEIIIDMKEVKGWYQLGKPDLYSIANSLANMQQDINRITTGFKRIKTDVYTSKDREEENKAWKEEREKLREAAENLNKSKIQD